MLIGFFAASLSICTGFIVSYAIFHKMLGPDSWKALGGIVWKLVRRKWKYAGCTGGFRCK